MSLYSKFVGRYNLWIVRLLRWIIGALFVLSGFAKAVDPWGFIYKIEEYLGAWGISQPRAVILVVAIGVSAYEFIFGFMLALGAYRRWAPRWLMAMMAVWLPLTAYILIANPVSDCGCFGEMWHLSNFATFVKNLLITTGLVYLWRYNHTVGTVAIRPHFQWMASLCCLLYIIVVSLIGYMVQPLVDFRQYKVGTMLTANSDYDEGVNTLFVYSRDGVEREFGIDNLPDTTWTFVSRIDAPGSGNTGHDVPVIYDGDEDVTEYLLDGSGLMLILTLPEPDVIDVAYAYHANEMGETVMQAGGSVIGLLGGGEDAIEMWRDLSMASYPCYSVDDTSLKSLVRGSFGAVLVDDGEIIWKRSISSIDFETVEALGDGEKDIHDLQVDDKLILWLTAILVGLLTVIGSASHLFKGKKGNN